MMLLRDALESAPAAAPAGTTQLIEETVGEAMAAIGPEVFLKHVPLGDAATNEIILPGRVWCLKALRENARVVRCSLRHFHDYILQMVAGLEASRSSAASKPAQAKTAHVRMMQLWALLPAYCANPCDLVEALPLLQAPMMRAVRDARFPELLHTICHAIQNLVGVQTPVSSAPGDMDSNPVTATPEARVWLPEERTVMEQFAKSMMPALFKVVDGGATSAGVQPVLDALSALSTVASSALIGILFKTLLQKLLESTLAAGDTSAERGPQHNERAIFMSELAISLVPSLTEPSIALLYNAIKPIMTMDVNPTFQKRCYKILLAVCDHFPGFSLEKERLLELLQLLTTSLMTCHVSSRQMRLRCLVRIVEGFDQGNSVHMEAIPTMVGEVILCTKDSNAKAREVAYELLLTLADRSGSTRRFVEIVSAALAAKTPHMRSAAVLSLTRLLVVSGPKDAELQQMIPELLSTVLVLLHEQAREVVKAVIGFVRVAISVCDATLVAPVVPQIVDGLMRWAGETKNRFRAQIKLVMKKLCRLYGFEHVAGLLPADDQPLITYLQKMASRSRRQREAGDPSAATFGGGNALANSDTSDVDDDDDEDMNGDEEDEDDDEEEEEHVMTGISGFKGLGGSSGGRRSGGKGGAHVHDEIMMHDHDDDGDVVDLLDASLMNHMKVKSRNGKKVADPNEDDGFGDIKLAADGRMIIPDDSRKQNRKVRQEIAESSMASDDEGASTRPEGKRKRAMGAERAPAASTGQRKKVKVKKAAGHEYKSKKGAGGDVKKAGMYEPYAYIPLDGKALSSKKKKGVLDEYAGIVTKGRAKNKRR